VHDSTNGFSCGGSSDGYLPRELTFLPVLLSSGHSRIVGVAGWLLSLPRQSRWMQFDTPRCAMRESVTRFIDCASWARDFPPAKLFTFMARSHSYCWKSFETKKRLGHVIVGPPDCIALVPAFSTVANAVIRMNQRSGARLCDFAEHSEAAHFRRRPMLVQSVDTIVELRLARLSRPAWVPLIQPRGSCGPRNDAKMSPSSADVLARSSTISGGSVKNFHAAGISHDEF